MQQKAEAVDERSGSTKDVDVHPWSIESAWILRWPPGVVRNLAFRHFKWKF